jgi:hypothetical protein
MKMSKVVFSICFVLYAAAMYGQAGNYFTESIQTSDSYETTPQCGLTSDTAMKISCRQPWTVADIGGGIMKVATDNGYGTKQMYTYTELTVGEGITASDYAAGQESDEDTLSVVGLIGQPKAFVRIEAECLQCAQYANKPAVYTLNAWWGPNESDSGMCEADTPQAPHCTLHIPVIYDINTEQPYPIVIAPYLGVTNQLVVENSNGLSVNYSVVIGFGNSSATVRADVVNPKGAVIKGVTVIGSSGHTYN